MTRYSVDPRVFVKGNGYLYFAKNMGKNFSENICKNVSGKYGQKLLDHAKQSAADAFKTSSKRVIQNSRNILVIQLDVKLLIKLQKVAAKNYSEVVTNEHDKQIPEERHVSPNERQDIY